jgi:hypothetical protein
MKSLVTILIYILTSHLLFSQIDITSQQERFTFREIANIDLLTENLEKYLPLTTEILTSNRKSIGKFSVMKLGDLVKEAIKTYIGVLDERSICVVAIRNKTHTIINFPELDKKNSKIPAIVIAGKITGTVGDTIVVQDKKNQKGKVDLDALDAEFRKAALERIFLNINKLSQDDMENFFINNSIIFPQDINTNRWLMGVEKIKIYYYKN